MFRAVANIVFKRNKMHSQELFYLEDVEEKKKTQSTIVPTRFHPSSSATGRKLFHYVGNFFSLDT